VRRGDQKAATVIHLSPAGSDEHVNRSELQLRAQGPKVVYLERHSNETNMRGGAQKEVQRLRERQTERERDFLRS